MSKTDLKKKTSKELEKALKENRKSLAKFRFGVSGSRTRDIKEGRNLKKDIARILTEIHSR